MDVLLEIRSPSHSKRVSETKVEQNMQPFAISHVALLRLKKAPLRGKNVGTFSLSFTPCTITSRYFKWDGDTHMSRRFVEDFHLADGNELLKWGREGEPYLTAIVTAKRGVPPKSPDHSDVNTSRISTQTHQEAHSLTMSGDV